MIRVKNNNVRIPSDARVLFALIVFESVYSELGFHHTEVVITSGSEPTEVHMPDSLHYKERAVDIRSRNLPSDDAKQAVLAEVRRRVGKDYDVILEGLGKPYEHFHVEFDPKQ